MATNASGHISIFSLLETLRRRKLMIVIPTVVTAFAALVGVMMVKPSYESIATLAFESSVPLTRTVAQATGVDEHMSEQARILRSRIESATFLETVAVQVGLHQDPKIIERANKLARQNPGHDKNDILLRECVAALQHMLDVFGEGSSLFYIRAVADSPERAHAIASTVAARYIESTREGRLRQSEEAYNFAQEQVAIYEKKLEEKRREFRKYEQEASLRPLTASQVTQANVGKVNSVLSDARAEVEFRRGRAEVAKSRVAEARLDAFASLGLIKSTRLDALERTVLELERHLALTLVEYPERDPEVTSLKNQIAAQSQLILAEAESLAKLAFPTLPEESLRTLADAEYARVHVQAAETRQRAVEDLLSRYTTDLASVSAEELRLNRLKEEQDGAERLYEMWLEQANSTQIAKAVESANVANPMVLIESARVPLKPFAPNKKRVLMLAVGFGVVLGIAAAVLAEYFDLTLVTVEEVEAVLGAPILGAVPRMQSAVLLESEERHRMRIRWVVAAAALGVLALAFAGYWFFVGPAASG
jgi:uncharacterized protein involved in exopolysaccharide biosynthesis